MPPDINSHLKNKNVLNSGSAGGGISGGFLFLVVVPI